MQERTQNLHRILVDSPLRKKNATAESVGVHECFDRVFFMGDLNIRMDAKREDIEQDLLRRWSQARRGRPCNSFFSLEMRLSLIHI